MKFLIGDIGNTSTKICILNRKFQILRSYNFDTFKMYRGNFLKDIFRKKVNKKINPVLLFSSVVPKVLKNIEKSLKSTKFKILEIKNLNLDKIIKINIKNKKNLGSDRIANAIGAKKFKNCLIIDFGTATTFDIVKNGVYEGATMADCDTYINKPQHQGKVKPEQAFMAGKLKGDNMGELMKFGQYFDMKLAAESVADVLSGGGGEKKKVEK